MSLHRNVWPEAIYFTRTTLFTYSELEVAITLPSFIALHFLVSEIAKWHEAVYWVFFTRTTLFTRMFRSLKSMYIPSFILIVSELHAHLYISPS